MAKIDIDTKLKREKESFKIYKTFNYDKKSLREIAKKYSEEDRNSHILKLGNFYTYNNILNDYIIPYINSNHMDESDLKDYLKHIKPLEATSHERGREIASAYIKARGFWSDASLQSLLSKYEKEDNKKYNKTDMKNWMKSYLDTTNNKKVVAQVKWLDNLSPSIKDFDLNLIESIIKLDDFDEIMSLINSLNISKNRFIALRNAYFKSFPDDIIAINKIDFILSNAFKSVKDKNTSASLKSSKLPYDKTMDNLLNFCNSFNTGYAILKEYIIYLQKISKLDNLEERNKLLKEINDKLDDLNNRLNISKYKKDDYRFPLFEDLDDYEHHYNSNKIFYKDIVNYRNKLLTRYSLSEKSLSGLIDDALQSNNFSLKQQVNGYLELFNRVTKYFDNVTSNIFKVIEEKRLKSEDIDAFDYYKANPDFIDSDIIKIVSSKKKYNKKEKKNVPLYSQSLKLSLRNFINTRLQDNKRKDINELIDSYNTYLNVPRLSNDEKYAIAYVMQEDGIPLTDKVFIDFARAYEDGRLEIVDENNFKYKKGH